MQVDSPEKVRNLAITGHNDTGKTTLASALLYASGVATRLHRVEDGNTVTDFDPEEIERGISIGLATCYAPWNQHKLNLIDTPGYSIFFSEARAAMRAADAALLCINGVAGIEVTTEKAWDFASDIDIPVMIHLTKMDRERADLEALLPNLRERFSRTVIPVQLPIGSEAEFEGVVDLVPRKAYMFDRDGNGKGKPVEVPESLNDQVEEWRNQLIEAVAETDDALMEQFFEAGTLPEQALADGLRRAVRERAVFPVTVSAGAHGIGPSALMDSIVDIMPNPLQRKPFPATNVGGEEMEVEALADGETAVLVFKTLSDPFTGKVSLMRVVRGELTPESAAWNTREESEERINHLMALQGKTGKEVSKLVTGDIGGMAKLKHAVTGDTLCSKQAPLHLGWIPVREPAIAFAIEPKSKGDEEKIGDALHRLMEEDLTLRGHRDAETGEYLLEGTGQLHVEIAVAKLKKRFNVEVILHPPKVPYRETIRRAASGHGRHKKQSGGRGQFADCEIMMEPLPRGEDFDFADEIFGGSIPQTYRPAVRKGIEEARVRGYLAGYRVVDFKVRLLDGKYHDVDSSEMAFKIAGSLAFKDAMSKAGATMLEPIMKVEISTTEEFMGDIMSDLSQRRGRPQGMDARNDGTQVVNAVVPMAEMLNYAPALRSMTQGRSSFHMEVANYEEVPRSIQQKLIAEAQQAKEES